MAAEIRHRWRLGRPGDRVPAVRPGRDSEQVDCMSVNVSKQAERSAQPRRSDLVEHPARGRGDRRRRSGDGELRLRHRAQSRPPGGRRRPSRRPASRLRRHGRRDDPLRLRRRAARQPGTRRDLPLRHRRGLRPRSGLRAPHRAAALLQGLPRHPDAPSGALAVERAGGATSRSTCRAARRRCSRPTSIRPCRWGAASSSTMPPASSSARRP